MSKPRVIVGPALERKTTIASASGPRSGAAGSSVALAVTVSGTTPLTYQWKKNDVAIAGATTSTLSLRNVTAA